MCLQKVVFLSSIATVKGDAFDSWGGAAGDSPTNSTVRNFKFRFLKKVKCKFYIRITNQLFVLLVKFFLFVFFNFRRSS